MWRMTEATDGDLLKRENPQHQLRDVGGQIHKRLRPTQLGTYTLADLRNVSMELFLVM